MHRPNIFELIWPTSWVPVYGVSRLFGEYRRFGDARAGNVEGGQFLDLVGVRACVHEPDRSAQRVAHNRHLLPAKVIHYSSHHNEAVPE